MSDRDYREVVEVSEMRMNHLHEESGLDGNAELELVHDFVVEVEHLG